MNQRNTLLAASVLGALAVTIGAFGAHALKPSLVAAGKFEVYELATRYQFYHTLALLAIGILQQFIPGKKLEYASLFMLIGTVFFSGSLYLLCFVTLGGIGIITPIGGVFLILGWLFLLLGIAAKK
ncbi:DUF423 domain-containing protein [Ohtaekwangia koreensis]|uniref:Uncharacterized membrane protein YgdD, TMEM256/DUF423 family n=1 Tax=Ohtaekwangia koreensis TaxID=688867 RepID=A0A1T5ME94_9BACT|nr:DUF423 domain-containing protein [Ohtaekwangia koreensis]SKC86561.1 Uncharacterized membrane protein YgdD, TMEM256/DUF423 family [Ohtaekwangia koreensis]